MKKRILSIALAAIICFSALSITAYAVAEKITEITVTGVKTPYANQEADFGYEIPENANYKPLEDDSSLWSETEAPVTTVEQADNGYWYYQSEGLFFNEDCHYTFIAVFEAEDGYAFDSKLSATINGQKALVDFYDNKCYVYLPFEFGTLETISSVEITGVTAPVAGQAPDWDFEIPQNANYFVDISEENETTIWSETSYKVTCYADADAGTWYLENEGYLTRFESDKYYTFITKIETYSGYIFANDVTVTVNGKPAIIDYDSNYLYIYLTFEGPEKAEIKNVDINNVSDPYVNAEFSWNAQLPENSNYMFSTDSDYNICIYWAESSYLITTITQADSATWYSADSNEPLVFDSGRYYTFVAILEADSASEFSRDNITAQVNGITALTDWMSGKLYVYLPLNNPNIIEINKIEITDLDEPVADEDIDWDYDIPENAPYSKYYDDYGDAAAWIETEEKVTSIAAAYDGFWMYESEEENYGYEYMFYRGYYYTFATKIEPNSGYTFANDVTATVNGKEALVENYNGVLYVYMPYDVVGSGLFSWFENIFASIAAFFARIAEFFKNIFTFVTI